MERLSDAIKKLNPQMEVLPLSCTTGEGFDAWLDWLEARLVRGGENG